MCDTEAARWVSAWALERASSVTAWEMSTAKSSRSDSASKRAFESDGNARSSGVANCALRKGMPSASSAATTGRAHSSGLRVTTWAQRRQNTESAEIGALRRTTASASIRRPSRARSAGTTTMALKADSMTTALPVTPTERRK